MDSLHCHLGVSKFAHMIIIIIIIIIILIIRSFDREPTSQSVVFSEALHKSNVRITENINMVIKNRIKGYNQ